MPSPQIPQPTSIYVVGDTVRVDFAVTVPGTPVLGTPIGSAPTYVDPGSITVRVEPPVSAGYTLTYGVDAAIVRVSAGIYRVTIPIGMTDVRRWLVRWRSTANVNGDGASAREWSFQVVASSLANPN